MRTRKLKQATIGVVIVVFLAVVLLSLFRIQQAHNGEKHHEKTPSHHHGAVFHLPEKGRFIGKR